MEHRDRRADRRAFIREHHPDRGGDPSAFASGLAAFERPATPAPRVIVVRRRPLLIRVVGSAVDRVRRVRRPPRVR